MTTGLRQAQRVDHQVVEHQPTIARVLDLPIKDQPDQELVVAGVKRWFQTHDGWLLIPADHPLIEPEVLDGLLTRWSQGDCEALLPTLGQRRGHPTLMRWSLATRIEQLPRDVGVNTLLRSSPNLVTEWPTDRESVLADLDTPEDYTFWQQKLASKPA